MEKSVWHVKLKLGFIILFQLFVHIFVRSWHYFGTGDTDSYIQPALNFVSQGIFCNNDGSPILFRTPGYPLFLAIVYYFGGTNNVILWLQVLMCLLNSVMIYKIVSSISSERWGILATVFYVMDFAQYTLAAEIMSDILFSFLMVLSMFVFRIYMEKQKVWYLVILFVLMNYAMFVRPGVMYLLMLVGVGLLIACVLRKVNWKIGLIYVLIFAMFYGGWTLRNYHYYEEPVFTTVREGTNTQAAIRLIMVQEGVTNEVADELFTKEVEEKYFDYSSGTVLERYSAGNEIAKEYFKENFGAYILTNVKGLFNELIGPGLKGIREIPIPSIFHYLIAGVVACSLLILYGIYLSGFFKNIKKLRAYEWGLIIICLYFMASTAIFGYSRYRLSFYPFCIVGACIIWRERKTLCKEKCDDSSCSST